MNIIKNLISNNNSYADQVPKYIVIHNTDNFAAGADANAHARAQYNGNFAGASCHIFVDDKEAYQATPFNRGAWHVGVNYGGRLFGIVNNHNSVGIEMCVQKGYNYEKAFQNTVNVCKQLMMELGIPADRVVSHYDVCGKNCPSQIRAKGDWNRFKDLIGGKSTADKPPVVDKLYRIRKSWTDSKSQIGAYKSLDNAKKEWKEGYTVFDWDGKAVYPKDPIRTKADLTGDISMQLPVVSKGCTGIAVSVLQTVLGTAVTGTFTDVDVQVLKKFQENTNQAADGICGMKGWTAVIEHMQKNTFK